jgi:peptidoglycan/xylan/chitin deacetylase (PgdA/CDA1 family)
VLAFGFHRVERFTGFEITRLSPLRFSRILDLIEDSEEPILTADATAGDRGIVMTFDDGFASVADTALPILAARGWTATVFLVAGSIGATDDWDVRILGRQRPMMSWAQARYWSARGMTFGSHTMTHPDLTALTPVALREELVASKRIVEDQLGREVTTLSYPFGRHSRRVREAAMEAGYNTAFASCEGRQPTDPFSVGRVLINSLMSLLEIRSLLDSYCRDGALNEDWRGHWRNRFFSSLSAGSATVNSWRRWAGGQKAAGQHIDTERIAPESPQ